jgi:serine protease AprX
MNFQRGISGGLRSSALWGKGGRGLKLALVGALLLLALTAPGRARAAAYVPGDLLAAARANPTGVFPVIVQGSAGRTSTGVAKVVGRLRQRLPVAGARGVRRTFRSINGVSTQLSGRQIAALARSDAVSAITRDARVKLAGIFSNDQDWPQAVGITGYWNGGGAGSYPAPTIAVVDSGVDPTRADLGSRLVAQVNLSSLAGNSSGDGYGHGTFVASLAAGEALGHAGASPRSKIVSLDVMDDNGMAMTSDVIAAADWILRNKDAYKIRIANFSLQSSVASSFMYDPLDKAVERLWFGGVVVVTSAGNYASNGQAVTVGHAPANDPFVLTVGAADEAGTTNSKDDVAAPWSAHGYTLDGFLKPDVGAPGRYLVGAVPPTSQMALTHPERITSPGYMQMSGTSFAAPIVAGTAAYVLALHPDYTPDQVKGALMVSARATAAQNWALGVGEVLGSSAVWVSNPPNPNRALDHFLVPDPAGGSVSVFDAASWANAASADASWANASWAAASWSTASWSTASWATASWATASWATASWADASWATASWASASWADASWVW